MKKCKSIVLITALILSLVAAACGRPAQKAPSETLHETAENAGTIEETGADTASPAGISEGAGTDTASPAAIAEEAGADAEFPAGNPEEVAAVILHTNDVHVGLEENIGYDGLALYKKEVEALYDHVLLVDAGDAIQGAAIGDLSVDLIKRDENGNDLSRTGENELCELAADAFRSAGKTQAALIGAGTVRTNLESGEVTYKDVVDILPYCNEVIMTEVSGQMLLDALEFGVSFLPDEAGAFPQVSGITFRINKDIESSVRINEKKQFLSVDGEYRVSDVKVDGKDLDPEAIYTLAISDYLFTGGDGYTMFENANIISSTKLPDNEVVMKYIEEDLNGVIPEKYAGPQGRILD